MESGVRFRVPEAAAIRLRPLEADDVSAATAVVDHAFGPGRYAKTAERLREGNRHLEGVSLVAEERARAAIIGAAFAWPVRIGTDHATLLGPFAILPRRQGQGIGRKLLAETLDRADDCGRGHIGDAILLVGDLSWYGPFGFVRVGDRIRLPGPVDPDRILLRPLLTRHRGEATAENRDGGYRDSGTWSGLVVPAFRYT